MTPNFTFSREWMRGQAARLADPRREEARVGRQFNLPPSYLLVHRVTLGSIGVLCQLGASAPFRTLAERWQPGFTDVTDAPGHTGRARVARWTRVPGAAYQCGHG